MKKEEALFKFLYNDNFDGYSSLEEAIEDQITESRHKHYGVDFSFETPDGEYLVLTDSEAEEMALESIKSLYDDIGLEGFNVDVDNLVDTDWFETAEREMHESYASDIENESSSDDYMYVNRLHEECCDYGLMEPCTVWESEPNEEEDEEAYAEWEKENSEERSDKESEASNLYSELAEKMMSGDSVEYYKDNFGTEEFNEVVKNNSLVDEDKLAQEVLDTDGAAHILATYDGDENNEGGYNIYRID